MHLFHTTSRSLRGRGIAAAVAAGATALVLAGTSFAGGDAPDGGEAKTAKNVVLFIGDGMGVAHRDHIRLQTVGLGDDLAMDELSVAGMVHTDASGALVTDSAASATAYATGEKTTNGAVGVDAEGNPIPTILEHARDSGRSTGLVSTGQVTDATPAAFGAHVADRGEQSEIARQFIEETKVDVMLGGGEGRWLPEGEPGAFPDNPPEDPEEQSSSDQGNLIEAAQGFGYEYVSSAEGLAAAEGPKLLGLFANEEMFQQRPEGEGDIYEPVVPLVDMTRKALDTLSQDEDGFFLMVEEEGVDEFAHSNNATQVARSGAALDEAVAAAVEFQKQHPDTLVLVTADHETGGMSMEPADEEDESGDGESAEDGPFTVAGSDQEYFVDWTTTGHTANDVEMTAEGPGAGLFGGVYDNTAVFDGIAGALGLDVE